MKQLEIGDIIKAKNPLTKEMVRGPIVWVQPVSGRVLIKNCGCLFRPTEVEYMNMFIKDMRGPYGL